ncbi:hypothetical protein EVAR_52677_1 [Eumeta japonica]|uniref:Uncharacterized protein n=1 Tax=Eumeta variegata TaxID=151549 RepID=A0A4C1ZM20_EUMVA|nr:hypothetical protein EVAR_52677_1 [Eumeta japonica]
MADQEIAALDSQRSIFAQYKPMYDRRAPSNRCVKRSTLLGRGNRKRQSESECVALERMRVVYLLQASARVSDEQRPIFQ